jgi:hypothetical protein
MPDEQQKLAALKNRAEKLGYQIEPSVNKLGYCLWQSWPGVGRHMVIGRDGGITLDVIAQKLGEVEAEAAKKAPEVRDHTLLAPQGCGPDIAVVSHRGPARPDTSAPAAETSQSSPARGRRSGKTHTSITKETISR